MTPEAYLTAAGPKPLDEDEIKEAVRELLMSSAPPALIRVIGRTAYQACVPRRELAAPVLLAVGLPP